MKSLIADCGSTKTHWVLVETQSGMPHMVRAASTMGLNPLYVTPAQITSALRSVLDEVGEECPDEVRFYGAGCSGERVAWVEKALRTALTPLTCVIVDSDLKGAALALTHKGDKAFISCILGTGAIAALYNVDTQQLQPMPALGYILGDEGSGAWFGRQLLSDYLKCQMPAKVREAFEEDYGAITAEQAINHVYQQPCPNRYLATFASFLGRHLQMRYVQELAFNGIDLFWRRNVMRIAEVRADVLDVRLVGSLAWSLKTVVEQVAESHGYIVTQALKDPIEGLI